MARKRIARADEVGQHEVLYKRNRERLLKLGGNCGICGKPVDVSIRDPHNPLAATIDHIVPISKGGHPSALENLQLAHRWCNRQKSDKLFMHPLPSFAENERVPNDTLPLHYDWENFHIGG